jgi:hypothetical protein
MDVLRFVLFGYETSDVLMMWITLLKTNSYCHEENDTVKFFGSLLTDSTTKKH